MKYAENGFRPVQDLAKHQRGLLATTVLAQEEVAERAEETQAERELRLFLAGETAFADCQFVPARYRVFEDPKFYGPPVRTVTESPAVTTEVVLDEDQEESIRELLHETRTTVIEKKPSPIGWRWLDSWGDLQPACC